MEIQKLGHYREEKGIALMKSRIKKIFFFSIILSAGLCTVLSLKNTNKINVHVISEGLEKGYEISEAVLEVYKKKNVICMKKEEYYEVSVYEKNKKVFSEVYLVEPEISEISEGIFEIRISVGSPAANVYYVDTKDFKISAVYFNPILLGDKYVAYMENGELILTDLFQEGILNKKIIRDFTRTANPISAIIKIEISDDKCIELEYYRGTDYMKESEVIMIDKNIG